MTKCPKCDFVIVNNTCACPGERKKAITEDYEAFGDQWVYCNQHLRPHKTGWCTVGVRNKVALGVKTEREAFDKCRLWGFKLYDDEVARTGRFE